jgi:hypothetical protein
LAFSAISERTSDTLVIFFEIINAAYYAQVIQKLLLAATHNKLKMASAYNPYEL